MGVGLFGSSRPILMRVCLFCGKTHVCVRTNVYRKWLITGSTAVMWEKPYFRGSRSVLLGESLLLRKQVRLGGSRVAFEKMAPFYFRNTRNELQTAIRPIVYIYNAARRVVFILAPLHYITFQLGLGPR